MRSLKSARSWLLPACRLATSSGSCARAPASRTRAATGHRRGRRGASTAMTSSRATMGVASPAGVPDERLRGANAAPGDVRRRLARREVELPARGRARVRVAWLARALHALAHRLALAGRRRHVAPGLHAEPGAIPARCPVTAGERELWRSVYAASWYETGWRVEPGPIGDDE